jgi:hypothetical protein
MARARVYLASMAARQQLEALEESYQRESNWRKSESERALQRWAAIRARQANSLKAVAFGYRVLHGELTGLARGAVVG